MQFHDIAENFATLDYLKLLHAKLLEEFSVPVVLQKLSKITQCWMVPEGGNPSVNLRHGFGGG